ncbi:MAG: hypothetical protein Q4C42_07915 [Clostridia bacterium]|nr:hypothetical protein [Clostridia bacterium]
MKKLWTCIDKLSWKAENKYSFAMIIAELISAIFGFILWRITTIWGFDSTDSMLYFIFLPAVIAWCSVIIYAFGHEFHSGTFR